MKKIAYLISVLLFFILNACEIDNSGCTDPDAINFDGSAEVESDNCKYEGRVTLWYAEESTDLFSEYNIHSIRFYVNNELIDSTSSTLFFTSAPLCEAELAVSTTQDLDQLKEKDFTIKVVDEEEDIVWEYSIEFIANACKVFELKEKDMYPYLVN